MQQRQHASQQQQVCTHTKPGSHKQKQQLLSGPRLTKPTPPLLGAVPSSPAALLPLSSVLLPLLPLTHPPWLCEQLLLLGRRPVRSSCR